MTLLSSYNTDIFYSALNSLYRAPYRSLGSYLSHFVPVNDNSGTLEVQLAGFSKDEISVYVEKNNLYVKAVKQKDTASRSFHRSWDLAQDEKIGTVRYKDGLLSIEINRVVPDELKRVDYKIE